VNVDRSIVLAGVDIGKKIKLPVYSTLLIHEEGPILIDVGFDPDGLSNPERAYGPRWTKMAAPELTEADDIRSRLQELRIRVSDIKMVILTHLHWDHSGALRFFTHCPILVQQAEYRFALNPDRFLSPSYLRNHFDLPLNYRLLEGDQIIFPGVSVIKTPGLTAGHQSVLLKLASGSSYILSGDAISLEESLKGKIPGSIYWNTQQAIESMYRLEHLSNLLEAEIIPSHDLRKWNLMKKSPEAYK
jgi:glyoxylase-like metal-dependent hydrolase (beta-lactamase superfamily II)